MNQAVYSLLLEGHAGVGLDVAKVNGLSDAGDVGVLLAQQPADVGEEEAAISVHGVGIGLGELMVHAVVAGPLPDGVL